MKFILLKSLETAFVKAQKSYKMDKNIFYFVFDDFDCNN